MATYVGFLRAINLGPTRKFPKAAIVAAVEGVGFTDVETYINTGNVRFTTRMRSRTRIEEALEAAFAEAAGFAVPTVVFTARELTAISEHAEKLAHGGPALRLAAQGRAHRGRGSGFGGGVRRRGGRQGRRPRRPPAAR